MGLSAKNWLGASGAPPAGDFANAVVSGVFTGIGPGLAFGFQGWANFALWCGYNSALTVSAGTLAASVAAIGGILAGEAINSVAVPPGTTVGGGVSGNNFNLALPILTMYGTLLSNGQIIGLPSTTWLQGATVAGPNIPAGTIVDAIVTAAVPQPSFPGGQAITGTVQLSNAPTGTLPTFTDPGRATAFTFALAAAGLAAAVDNNAIFTGADINLANTQVNIERSFDGGATFIPCNIGVSGQIATYGSGPIDLTWMEPERGVIYRLNCILYTAVAGVTLNYRMSQTAGAPMAMWTGGVV